MSNITPVLDSERGQGFSGSDLHSFTGLHSYVSYAQAFGQCSEVQLCARQLQCEGMGCPRTLERMVLGTNRGLGPKASSGRRGSLG